MLGQCGCDCSTADTAAVENGHCDLKADALGSEQSVCRKLDIIEGQSTGA